MKYSKSIPLVGITVALIGILGMNTLSASPSNIAGMTSVSDNNNAGQLMGHITMIVKDKYGNTIGYRQTDNSIVNVAKNCAATVLFGATTAQSTCAAAPSTFNIIGLGKTAAVDFASTVGTVSEQAGTGLAATTATSITVSASTANGGSTKSSVTTLSNQFTSATGTTAVTAADLRDSASNLFATQTFSSVTLNNGDSLTVNWQITLAS